MISRVEREGTPAPRVVLVVPCYDEALRLDVAAFERALGATPRLSLVLVDDGSTDATPDVLRQLAAAHPTRCEVLSLARNVGKAEAVRTGLRHALAGPAAYVGYWDADLATPFDALPDFATALDRRPDCQAVLGSRVRLLGRRIERRTTRHYLGRIFATVASIALRMPVYDTQCGAKLFRASPRLRDVVAEPFTSRWAFDVELIARLRAALGAADVDEAFCELPLLAWHDVAGSKLRASSALRSGLDLLWIGLRSRRPSTIGADAAGSLGVPTPLGDRPPAPTVRP
jgi:glycosyltransferase involved in cell wall biosynthesis